MTDARLRERIDQVTAAMPLEKKVRLLSGADMFTLLPDKDIGLEPIVLSDGPTGVRGPVVVGGRASCLLPNASLLAQTWDREALAEVGDLLAEEAIDQHTHVVLGPTINLHRTPLGGRLFEAFSEDPLLTGHLAAAYVRALQARGVAATPKHFLGNESETERTTVDVVMSPQTLREVYLAPFEIVVEDAHPWTLMAAYNSVNGLPSTEQSDLVNGVVKGEWEYDGLVMSDWLATKTAAESANGGLDLVMPGPVTPWSEGLLAEVSSGAVAEQTIDDHVRRLLLLAARVGAFASHRTWETNIPRPDSERRREQLRRLAASGMVVLKNDNATLPLRPDDRVALVGRHALDTIAQGGGSAQVRPPHLVSVVDGMSRHFAPERLTVTDGVETRKVLPAAPPALVRDPESGEQGMRVRVFDEAGRLRESRHLDVAELEDSQTGWLADAASIELSAALNLPEPMAVQLGVRGPGSWSLVAPGHAETFRIPYHQGPGGGFFRPMSQTGTVHLAPGDVVTATVQRDELPRILGLVVATAARSSGSVIAAAAAAAQDADVAVVVVGLTPDQETEGQDKTTLALPGDQDALVAAVAASAARTVVVVNAATPVLMPWLDDVDAVLFAGLPGQEAGAAIAAALVGEVLPEGRLVTTFPRRDRSGPAWSTRPVRGQLDYTEGTVVGYRGWAAGDEEPAFWFGHGLGYTTWDYQTAAVTRRDTAGVEEVRVAVRNSGDHPGRETVQIYLAPEDGAQPTRLIGWEQVWLGPGAREEVVVSCDTRLQRCWDDSAQQWKPLTGGRVLVARGLGDVRATIPVPGCNDELHSADDDAQGRRA